MSVAGDEPLSPAGVPPVGTRDGAAWPADPWLVDSWLVEAPSDEERAIAAGAAAERGAEFAAMGDDDLDCYLAELDHPTDSHAHEAAPPRDDDLVADLATQPGDGLSLLWLESIDPASLSSPIDRVNYLKSLDRVTARTAALQARALAAVAGATSSASYLTETHLEHEVAVARRTSRFAAGRAIEMARSLVSDFPAFYAALGRGEVSSGHCVILVERTRVVVDSAQLATIERIVLPKARRMTPGEFAKSVAQAVMRVDHGGAVERHRRAKGRRRVSVRELDDGMGFLGLVDDWTTIHAMHATLSADARAMQLRRGGAPAVRDDEDAALGACRADALSARVLGTVTDDGSVSWQRDAVAVTAQLVIDLETLRGETDHPCLLDGQPVPAAIGREVARGVARWRRMVTDPVTGHLLDYGHEVYLPEPLRRYIGARDGICRAPGCSARSASRLELDHVMPFPEGPSSSANTGLLCSSPCHQLKTGGYVSMAGSAADGSCTWLTAWGQHLEIPARPFLVDPVDDELAGRATDPSPPPEPPPPRDPPPV